MEKKMKKTVLLIFFCMITCSLLIAQTEEFNQHMKQAKEYEAQKKTFQISF